MIATEQHYRKPTDQSVRGGPKVAANTGPLDVLAGRDVLVLEDAENLRYGARDLGAKVSHQALGGLLRSVTRRCSMHAFFSRNPGDNRLVRHYEALGWVAHPQDIQTVRTRRGIERRANSDNLIMFCAGVLFAQHHPELVVLASGDGSLVDDLARYLKHLKGADLVTTLSLAGSTSRRLDARFNTHIDANIELGQDCLQPVL